MTGFISKLVYPHLLFFELPIIGFLYGITTIFISLLKSNYNIVHNKISLIIGVSFIITISVGMSLFSFFLVYNIPFQQIQKSEFLIFFLISISSIVSFLIFFDQRRKSEKEYFIKKIEQSYKVVSQYNKELANAANEQKIDRILLTSIAILENISRPVWVRNIEYFLYKCPLVPIHTFGLMQVTSKKLLTDRQSIYKASKMIKKILSEKKMQVKDKKNLIQEVGKDYQGTTSNGKVLWEIYCSMSQK
ncbi:MAG TPA: hypothetical protein VLF89_06435 [Candidatus Saccharimonadales bacterium]|nr:hypothetical protein [Candidatus Saccharimonadales bacterium]